MENWQLAIVVLLALLVGALIPILVLLAATLTAFRKQLASTGRRLDDTLDEIRATAVRVNAASRGLEGSEGHLRALLAAVGGLAGTVDRINHAAKLSSAVISAVGPAALAFVQTLNRPAPEPAAPADSDPGNCAGT